TAAAPGADGWGQPGPASIGLLPSLEEFESEVEATVLRLEYAVDSAGAGRWRGAPGTETAIEFPPGSLERLYVCLAGASAGGEVMLNGEPAVVLQDVPLSGGAELRFRSPGGAGFGDPRD